MLAINRLLSSFGSTVQKTQSLYRLPVLLRVSLPPVRGRFHLMPCSCRATAGTLCRYNQPGHSTTAACRKPCGMELPLIRLEHSSSVDELDHIRRMFREYVDFLGIDLSFQSFEDEFAGLPGEYAPPRGRLLLAMWDDSPAGCVALRELGGGCEMKRLWVRPEYRGHKVGRFLAEAVIEEARRIGYPWMRLDTLSSLAEATLLYRSLGFREIQPYRYNPIEGAIYMELNLRQGQG